MPPTVPASPDRRDTERPSPSPVATVVERNIVALLQRRRDEVDERPLADRISDAVTRFTGSMTFVVIHLVAYATWMAANLGWLPGLGRLRGFDDGFTVLAMAASVEAIFLSTFVLISQNRMQAQADKRADLDLQVSLLAEHEVTELLRLTREIARRMDIAHAHDAALDELAQDIRPEVVLEHMEASEERFAEAEADPPRRG